MGILWSFRCYQDHRGRNEIHLFLSTLDCKALIDLRRAMQHLQTKASQYWARPHASPLGNHIYVIRFKSAQGQFRLFGHHDDNLRAFVITAHGVEKGRRYVPRNYEDIANRRMEQCRRDPQRFTCQGLDPDAEWRWDSIDRHGHFTPRLVK